MIPLESNMMLWIKINSFESALDYNSWALYGYHRQSLRFHSRKYDLAIKINNFVHTLIMEFINAIMGTIDRSL